MEPTRTGRASALLQLRVGTFILVALAVFVALVYALGRQAGLFERQYGLVAGFSQTGGLIQGATVRLAGVPIGHVSAIRLPEPGEGRVRVEVLVARRVRDRIRADSVARIETLGLLGDKIVEVSLGSAQAAVLPEGGELRTEEPFDTNRVTRQAADLLKNLVEVSGDLRTAVSRITESPVGSDLAETMRALRVVTTEIERGQGLLHRLVYDRGLGAAGADAARTIRQLAETAQRLDRLLADPRAGGLVADAGQVVAEAREASARVNRVLRQVEEGPGFLHTLIYDEGRLLRDLDQTLTRAGALMASVERGEGALGVLLRDPEAAAGVRRLTSAAAGLGEALERARTGDSLLRALLDDPALVADLRQTARHFREVTDRVARGEGLLGSLTSPGSEGLARQAADALSSLGRLGEDGRVGETLADLRAAMADLRAITGRIETGEGTVGGLIADPTVYENLAAFLEGAQRSLILRALIRAAIGRGSER